ncbi:MAG: hypothetical protein HYU84_06010 [Chloroflexi bacterium]|nr:hypothetical protein [Chloroflexota bacterium]
MQKVKMSGFQIGVLLLLGIIACGIVGLTSFLILNKDQPTNLIFSNPSNAILGKWETDDGALYEFFPDGTVMTPFLAGKYSFPDKTHIKIEIGDMAGVQEYSLSSNSLIMGNEILKRYEEFPITPQAISGTWKATGFNNKSECFKGLGIETPQNISFETNGNFSLTDFNVSMAGQYFINGTSLQINATGTRKTPSLLIAHPSGQPTPTDTPLQGQFNCLAVLSNSRLTFKDNLNQSTIFTRAKP